MRVESDRRQKVLRMLTVIALVVQRKFVLPHERFDSTEPKRCQVAKTRSKVKREGDLLNIFKYGR
jgi:hypothetical protein